MITIENSSLEVLFGDLLGVILGVKPDIGIALYFSPKAAIARLDLITNILPLIYQDGDPIRSRIEKLLSRSHAVMGKRHEIIHALWAENDVPGEPVVSKISFPKWIGGPVGIQDLYSIIKTYRDIIKDMLDIFNDLQPLSDEDRAFLESYRETPK